MNLETFEFFLFIVQNNICASLSLNLLLRHWVFNVSMWTWQLFEIHSKISQKNFRNSLRYFLFSSILRTLHKNFFFPTLQPIFQLNSLPSLPLPSSPNLQSQLRIWFRLYILCNFSKAASAFPVPQHLQLHRYVFILIIFTSSSQFSPHTKNETPFDLPTVPRIFSQLKPIVGTVFKYWSNFNL